MDNLKWQWTDLMPGDLIRFTKEILYQHAWCYGKAILKVISIDLINGRHPLYVVYKPLDIRISSNFSYYNSKYLSLDGTYKGIQVFEIIELIGD